MTRQTVNTLGIALAANKLSEMNANMTFIFGYLQSTAKNLDNDWLGRAGETARTKMYQVFKGNEGREEVFLGYINILDKKVNPDYAESEDDNKKLADLFK